MINSSSDKQAIIDCTKALLPNITAVLKKYNMSTGGFYKGFYSTERMLQVYNDIAATLVTELKKQGKI